MFLFKKKKIVLDCFTSDSFAYEYASISHATDYYPKWWKELDSKYIDNTREMNYSATMKYCKGFTDLYSSSIIIPFWGILNIDMSSKLEKLFKWQTNYELYNKQPIITHPRVQYTEFLDENYQHLKITSPWKFKTEKYIKFILTDPLYNRNELTNYSVLPGCIDFKYQKSTNINIMAEYKNEKRTININPLDPIAMLTPLIEEDIIIKTHLLDVKEFTDLESYRRIFTSENTFNAYPKLKSFLKNHQIQKDNKSKCPFGFGK
jgi:hypothetical protein